MRTLARNPSRHLKPQQRPTSSRVALSEPRATLRPLLGFWKKAVSGYSVRDYPLFHGKISGMPLIKVTNLEKVFESEGASTRALDGVDLSVEKGEFMAVVGPSGSGKSTLLQILGLLDGPSSGEYLLNGKDTQLFTDKELAVRRNKTMGFIFQSFNLLARTSVLENVKLPLAYSLIPPREWDRLAQKGIGAVELTPRVHHAPSQLSGGERQRVAIARALVNDPEIIFADEPTGNLDSVSGERVMDILEELHNSGKTVILITHDRRLAARALRAILMKDGAIVWDGDAKRIPEL